MTNNQAFTAEELFLFQHNGYLLLSQALAPTVVTDLRSTILHHAAARIAPLVCEDPARHGQPIKGDIPGARVLRLSKVIGREPTHHVCR